MGKCKRPVLKGDSGIPVEFREGGNSGGEFREFPTFVKSPKTPSHLMGEGRGEGEYSAISTSYAPPLYPLPRGEGKSDFLQVPQY